MGAHSRGGDQEADTDCRDEHSPLILDESRPQTIRYTYRVSWNVSDISVFACPSYLTSAWA